MKIVIIGTTAESMIRFRKDFIELLCCNGHEVYAFANDYDEIIRENIESLGAIPVDYVFSRAGFNPFLDVLHTYKLFSKIKNINPDVVLSYFSKPAIFGTIAAKLARVKNCHAMLEGLGFYFTESQDPLSIKKKLLKRVIVLLYKFSFRYVDSLILLNVDDKNELLIKENIRVKNAHILGGIGLNMVEYPYVPPPTNPVSFIFVARFLKEKGVYEFIQAAKTIKKKYPSVHFYMLGQLDLSNPGSLRVEDMNKLRCDNIIEFPGYVKNVQEWLARASVFVLPSYREGFPRSTQEAMAIGRAVITCDVPGCRETVIDGVNGFLIPAYSSDMLVQRMLCFIHDPQIITRMGMESYKIARDNFDSVAVNAKLINMLQLDIGRPPR
ncbi:MULTISPECIES: glycosyltransferase family 4 protein [Dickeya]|uniref:glycosyltransferase family 4 protein n=1 Tax=Dickeya TaxID=204037 RepID=UPI0002E0EAE2|nr:MULTISPECIES: glycosyltransferase family 4 protein [Dickeya]AJC65198.1 glycosyl transferase family 1 [Dickeya zeae EC1]